MWQLEAVCVIALAMSTTAIVANKLHDGLTQLTVRHDLYRVLHSRQKL